MRFMLMLGRVNDPKVDKLIIQWCNESSIGHRIRTFSTVTTLTQNVDIVNQKERQMCENAIRVSVSLPLFSL